MPGAHLGLVAADVDVAVGVVPRRDPVSPPQLAAHAPVPDVAHPLEVGARPALGHEARASRRDGRDRGSRERRDLHVPLVGEVGLEDRAAAIAARHHELVRLDALDEARRLELGEHAPARLEALESPEALGHRVRERRARSEDVDERQVMSLADLVVVEVVGGCDLEASGAEGRIDVGVGDDRDQAPGERQPHLLTREVPVARIVRVHGDRGVAQHGLGTGGRHHDMPGAVVERVAQVPELAVLLLRLHLEVRERGEQHRIPVDEALAAVDQAFLVQPHEHLDHGPRDARIHGESVARPVDRVAEAAHLGVDRAARLLFPSPHALEEGFAREVGALDALRVELPLDQHLRGDARVVGPRLPQHRAPEHAVIAAESVHQRVLERVPHVQRSGHVRRGDHDAVGSASPTRREPAVRLPALVDAPLDCPRRVHLVH